MNLIEEDHADEQGAGYVADVWRVASVTVLGSIMSVLDATIVNVALESLSHDLHSSIDNVQWVVTAYMLALAAVIPLASWMARRIGAKRLYLISIVLFTVGSVLCGLATTTGQLIIFRIIQGVGGGMVAPVGQTILVRAAGPKRLARVMAAVGVPIVLGPVLGPTLGGLLLDDVGWRWIFYVNVPIGIVAVLSAMRKLPADEPEDAGRFDLPGLVLSAVGLVGVTYGLAEIGVSAPLVTHVLVPLGGGCLLVAGFVVRALRIPNPLLDVRLYLDRAFSAASVTVFALGAALFGGMILMPLYYQVVRGESALYTGLLLAPRGLGASLSTWLGGRFTDRFGAGATSAMGCVLSLIFTVPFVMIGAHDSYLYLCVVMVCQGFGLGMSATPAFTAAFRSLRPSQIGDASPQLNIIMRIGGSIGTALLTVVLEHRLAHAGRSLSGQAGAFGNAFVWVLAATVLALIPTLVLIVTERNRRSSPTFGEETFGDVHVHVELG